MDTLTLVNRQIEDGESLLTQLKKEGFVVSAAFWARPAEDDRWSLYLATPAANEDGSLANYRKVLHAFRSLGHVSFRGSDVIKLISEKNPLVKSVLDLQKRFPDLARKPLSRSELGDLPFEEVYIYPLGEVRIAIYGMYYRGEPSGSLHLSFEPHNPHLKIIETEPSGVCNEYPAETGMDWEVAAPEGAKLERNELGIMKLTWDWGGKRRQSSANEVMALADLGRYGFRILHEPARVNHAG